MLAAVKQWGFALEYASAKLKDDREIVLEAVKRNGSALQHDREIALAAVQDGYMLGYASDESDEPMNDS